MGHPSFMITGVSKISLKSCLVKVPNSFIKCGCKIADILKVKSLKLYLLYEGTRKRKGLSVTGHHDDHKDYSVIKKA